MLPLLSILGLPLLASALSRKGSNISCHSSIANVSLPQNVFILDAEHHLSHTINTTSDSNITISNQHTFCGVNGLVNYGSNDTLHFSVWLPDSRSWNGRFMAVGNGGMAGEMDETALITQLNAGFAVAAGDAGHLAARNNNGSGAPNTYLPYLHDQDQVDAWIHNAISMFVPTAKELTTAFYDQKDMYSYYVGCSTGGAQGFALAQYHPDLFDGIIAGSPGNWYSHLALSFLWNQQKTQENATYLPQSALNLTAQAVLAACDSQDGVEDGLIEDPSSCVFDIDSLRCNSTSLNISQTHCLTDSQISAAKLIYAGPINPQTGEQYYPGFSFGSEIEWLLQEGDLAEAFAIPILQNLVYDNLTYDSTTFDWSTDVQDVDENAGAYIDEVSVNLTAFRDRGGKMLVYQGWADPFNAALWPIQHLKQLEDFYGEDISDFFNLFMIPGGGHCGAASYYPDVPAVYHTVPRLLQWVERGDKPRDMLSTNPTDGSERSRKLCPWPEKATYVQGSTTDWNSYVCEG